MVQRAEFDEIRTLGFAAITNAFQVIGPAAQDRIRGLMIINDTDGNMMFTTDSAVDKLYLKAGSFQTWDIQSNMNAQKDDAYILSRLTQFYVKYVTAPTTGSVYIECLTEP